LKDIVIGIDLGTTNSEVAVLLDGRTQVIPVDGELIMPSCVGVSPDGELLVGHNARNQMVIAPEETVVSIKRKMGTKTLTNLNGKIFTPEEISALILGKLKMIAQNYLGVPIQKAVITVPAYFDDAQRKATRNAGILAGLDVVRILNEPTAAALAYDALLKTDQVILVYDLGGGTFDVSLVVAEKGVVEVKASHGDTHLGGDDFDALLMEYVAMFFQKQTGTDLLTEIRSKNRLWQVVENAKRKLSDAPYVQIREEYFSDDNHLDIELSRSKYEEMIRPLIRRTLDSVHYCFKDAGILPKDIDKVILVGGAGRTPLIAEIIRKDLNIEPHFDIDPDLVVVMGAAIQAGAIAGNPASSVLVDITPHSIGTSVVDMYDGQLRSGIFSPVIKRNTPLPVNKSERFYTLVDGQQAVDVRIYQGEESLAERNMFVGNFVVEGLEAVPAGNELILNLNLDLNGILKVTAEEKCTGLSKTVRMKTGNQTKDFDLDTAYHDLNEFIRKSNVDAVDSDYLETDSSVTLCDVTTRLIERSVALLKEIDPADAKELKDLIDQCKNAMNQQAFDKLIDLNESLSDILFYLED
jgi:molecular chaperone DnaK